MHKAVVYTRPYRIHLQQFYADNDVTTFHNSLPPLPSDRSIVDSVTSLTRCYSLPGQQVFTAVTPGQGEAKTETKAWLWVHQGVNALVKLSQRERRARADRRRERVAPSTASASVRAFTLGHVTVMVKVKGSCQVRSRGAG